MCTYCLLRVACVFHGANGLRGLRRQRRLRRHRSCGRSFAGIRRRSSGRMLTIPSWFQDKIFAFAFFFLSASGGSRWGREIPGSGAQGLDD